MTHMLINVHFVFSILFFYFILFDDNFLILGDPGAVRGGGKKIGAKKSQERGEEPLGTEF